jgi:hypothetical protein
MRMKIFVWCIAVVPVLYLATCSYVASARTKAFDSVQIGDPEHAVIAAFGSPSFRESTDVRFTRYGATQCSTPCTERLWFENRLGLDMEAWSVELDGSRRVIKKSHWVSP